MEAIHNKHQIEEGDIIFHPELQNVLACFNQSFALVHNDEQYAQFEQGETKRYIVDNGGQSHTTKYKAHIDYHAFKVIDISNGQRGYDPYGREKLTPAKVICHPLGNLDILIAFYLNSNFYSHTLFTKDISMIYI